MWRDDADRTPGRVTKKSAEAPNAGSERLEGVYLGIAL
jgi:hypothetical protein